uniref:RIIa domain-containing protein n=1 Tax=Hucho hucho TaxID=62062 RepID=A0A4W5NZN9_9TELE
MNHPSTLILPWGLKSWLVAVSRAVLLEKPPNVLAFIASYFMVYCAEHPNLDIQELSYIFRDLRGKSFLVPQVQNTKMYSMHFP